ncbi:MAG TPA: methyltransferase domain-containing protein [Terriglobales bacterium]|nr:methyltransferase domain-containing protein [Terriglobales bacterium]
MISAIDPLLNAFDGARWLTVGDGRYGSDAHYIESQGSSALATDISDVLLKQAVKEGYIKEAQKENAEALSFQDGDFDFALCKDSLHHFPRPTLAIYEMLRVSKQAIALIEPNDDQIVSGLAEHVYRSVKDFFFMVFLRREKRNYQYEEVGNFIYTISRREIEKIALALNYEVVAFKGINNYYIDGSEYEKLDAKGPIGRRVRFMIAWRDLLSRLGLKPAGVLAVIIFKIAPASALIDDLARKGFRVTQLPRNPYAAR